MVCRRIRGWIGSDVRDPGTDLHDSVGKLYDVVLAFFPMALRRIAGSGIAGRAVLNSAPSYPRFFVTTQVPKIAIMGLHYAGTT